MAIIDKIQLSGTVYTIGNETTTAVTSASTDNEIPTAKAVYDAIPQGGGGKAIEAGRGISITTGETADTVSFNLPVSAGTGTNALIYNSTTNVASGYSSFSIGRDTIASGNYSFVGGTSFSEAEGEASFAFGYSVVAIKDASAAFGKYTITKNPYEFGCGILNKSVKGIIGSEDSGSTLFSVGNGKNDTRHNAFEIRQNGDIYIVDTNDTSTTNYYEKPMIKLQNALGGGGGTSYTAGDGIDITNDVISVTGKVDTSAITTSVTSSSTDVQVPSAKAVYDQLDGLKLKKITQSEYDALSPNYDANTLYVING